MRHIGMTLLFLLGVSVSAAQDCSPEAIEQERKSLSAGEFRGLARLNKLESLIRELKILSETEYKGAQKSAMRYCLKKKGDLFQTIMQDPESNIQQNSSYQDTLSDYYVLQRDFRTALLHSDRALTLNPHRLNLRIKNFHLFARTQNIELKQLSGKPIVRHEGQRLLMELSRRAASIAEHPEASREMAVEALMHQAIVEKVLKNGPQEMNYWEKILVLDPKHVAAHQNRFAYFIQKRLPKDAIEAMKRLNREQLATEKNWAQFLELLADSEEWEEFISWATRAPDTVTKDSADLQSRWARAYLELGRISEAQNIMKKMPQKLSGKTARIANQNKSRLLELEADELKKQNRLSEALATYKKALRATPRPFSVREKISLLIYDYRKSLNFQPPAATQEDLKEVVNLLEKSVYETELKSSLFIVYLHSLRLSNQEERLKKGCKRFREIYPELIRSKDYLSYCQ